MDRLQNIQQPVANEISRYEQYLRTYLMSDHRMTQSMIDYIFRTRGKGIRPLMVLLSAALIKNSLPLPEDTLMTAMLSEMVHTASLVHDDVIDEAYIRRGKPSVKALWRTPRAILIGDYLLAKSFTVGMQTGSYPLVGYIMKSMTDLCEGEMRQSEQVDLLEMDREVYIGIIRQKTASLIASSCGAGAMSVGASDEEVEKMRMFGEYLGIAFQIKDDILDYDINSDTGKPACNDLMERKITLPLLTVLENSGKEDRKRLLTLLSDVRNDPSKVEKIRGAVLERDGIGMAYRVMESYISEARSVLMSYPGTPFRNSLEELCLYFAERQK